MENYLLNNDKLVKSQIIVIAKKTSLILAPESTITRLGMV